MTLHVLYQTNDDYIIPTGISLYLMLEHNKDISDLHVHIINDGIERENRKKLGKIAQTFNRGIEWIGGKEINSRNGIRFL